MAGHRAEGRCVPFPSIRRRKHRLREPRQQLSLSGVIAVFEPQGFDWAALADDEVFIPFQGEATLDHSFRATATLDRAADGSATHVNVSLGDLDASHTETPALGAGDRFAWGSHEATVSVSLKDRTGMRSARSAGSRSGCPKAHLARTTVECK